MEINPKSGKSSPRRIKFDGGPKQPHEVLMNKFKVRKRGSQSTNGPLKRRNSDPSNASYNPAPKLEDCLISFSIAETSSDSENNEVSSTTSPSSLYSSSGYNPLDYLRRPYSRIGRLPNVPRGSKKEQDKYKANMSHSSSEMYLAGLDESCSLEYSNSSDCLSELSTSTPSSPPPISDEEPLSPSPSTASPTSTRLLPSIRELALLEAPDASESFDNVTLRTVTNLVSSEDNMINNLTTKFLSFELDRNRMDSHNNYAGGSSYSNQLPSDLMNSYPNNQQ